MAKEGASPVNCFIITSYTIYQQLWIKTQYMVSTNQREPPFSVNTPITDSE